MALALHGVHAMRSILALVVLCASACTTADATDPPDDDVGQGEVDQAVTTTPALSLARTFVVDGWVSAAATDGKTLYMGGQFRYIGERSGELAVVSPDTGARHKVVTEMGGGAVFAMVPDDGGGFYVVGDFRRAGSFTTRALAHLQADGTWDPAWRFEFQGEVFAIVKDSSRVYVGGSFATVNGQSRRNFAAFERSTASLVPGTPAVSAFVRAMAISPSTGRLFVGGDFDGEGGLLERIDLPAMTVSSWNPGTPDGSVRSLLAVGSGLYVGGGFQHIGSVARGGVASIDQATGAVRPYNPNTDGTVLTMVRTGSVLYLGGQFTTVGGQPRTAVAAVDASTGALQPWRVDIGSGFPIVFSVLPTAGAIYIGGGFDTVDGRTRHNAAAVDPGTGNVLAWNPHPNAGVWALQMRGSDVMLGGQFISVNGSDRRNLAAMDLTTRKSTSWAPVTGDVNPDWDYVKSMTMRGSTVWIGGRFDSLNGQPRENFAALSTAGDVLPFRADTDDEVATMAATSSRVYLGGSFNTVGGRPRAQLAAVDPTTGNVLAWAPTIGRVNSLVVAGPRLYAGGFGQLLGAWDVNGVAQPVPTVDGAVYSLAWDGSAVYISGQYQNIGGQARNGLAATVPGTTTVTSWNPPMEPFRQASVGVSDDYVYTGDSGVLRVFSKSTGALQSFSPHGAGGNAFIVLDDKLIDVGVGSVDYYATGGIAELTGNP